MSKGTQLWPGDKMRSFFSAHIRRETSLDDAAAERLAEALTKAVNRMLVWKMPDDVRHTDRVEAAPEIAARHARAENFNPYLFSAIVVLAKQGRDGLIKRLQEIKSAENLRAFAEAQHVPVDGKLRRLDDIRKAIVAAAEQRLADRKAAAS
ncbi:hypothetical protein HYPDE_35658 [Hyphomicrobium denitrificans 1NES1]|uniref:Uncharacterized protein n=1 Tax=Hyphomicrobium denitrificans 1NES1 TaxID=670307 RepID=N0B6Z9_9HYPH|nr:hypothetical protein [Hyphomicrobium denitrificans]AGK58803.1 hypothetical protein HYPDE_35658 [Hyphomicrobium denitrificans 1NES1]